MQMRQSTLLIAVLSGASLFLRRSRKIWTNPGKWYWVLFLKRWCGGCEPKPSPHAQRPSCFSLDSHFAES